MSQPSLHFRPAQPADAPIAAQLIYSAASEVYDFVFAIDQPTILDLLRRVFVNGSGIFGYQRYTVATLDNQVVAIGSFYGPENSPKPDLRILWTLITCFDPVRFVGIISRLGKMRSEISYPKVDTEFIANFAVLESLRGQGIGAAFLQHQIEVARSKGRKYCSLNVAETNPGAQRLYERLGFQVVGEVRWSQVTSRVRPPVLRQMELTL